jgi:hypothetical protein
MAAPARTPRPRKAMPRWLWYTILGVAIAVVVAAVIVTYAVGGHLF